MEGFLTQQYQPTPIADRMSNHGSKMAKVIMAPGVDIMAKAGSMVAYKGLIDFNPNPPAMGNLIKSWATGEGVQLMQATGQGELYLADYGSDVVVMQLANEALSAMTGLHHEPGEGHAGPAADLLGKLLEHAGKARAMPSAEEQSAMIAAEALRRLGSADAKQALERLAGAADDHVAAKAREALARFDRPA